jgi:hypothetical protein
VHKKKRHYCSKFEWHGINWRYTYSSVAEDSGLLGCYAVSYFEVARIGLLDPEDKFTVIFRHFGKRWPNITRLFAQDYSLNAFSFCQAGFYWTGSDSIIRSFTVIIDVVLQNNNNFCYFIKLDWEIMDIQCHPRKKVTTRPTCTLRCPYSQCDVFPPQ